MARAPIRTDVAIAGGGMVGLTLALALAQGGLKVAVADPMTPAQLLDERFDGRVSALAFASVRMLRALGLWDALAPDAQPINDIVVSDGELGGEPSPFSLHFDHREIGEVLGYIVENRHIRRALLRGRSVARRRIVFLPGVAVDALAVARGIDDDEPVGRPDDREPARGRRRGRESPLREAQGIRSVAWDYPQIGIVTTVEHERPHNGVAYEHFLPYGPVRHPADDRQSLVARLDRGDGRSPPACSALDEPEFTGGTAPALRRPSGRGQARSGRAGPIR